MEFGKLGGLRGFGGLGSLAGLGRIGRGSNSFLIWILLAVLVFGFGKGRGILPNNLFQFIKTPGDGHHGGRHGHGESIPPSPLGGLGGFARGPIGGLMGGNGVFILVVIVLLILCKDSSEGPKDTFVNSEEAVEE